MVTPPERADGGTRSCCPRRLRRMRVQLGAAGNHERMMSCIFDSFQMSASPFAHIRSVSLHLCGRHREHNSKSKSAMPSRLQRRGNSWRHKVHKCVTFARSCNEAARQIAKVVQASETASIQLVYEKTLLKSCWQITKHERCHLTVVTCCFGNAVLGV